MKNDDEEMQKRSLFFFPWQILTASGDLFPSSKRFSSNLQTHRRESSRLIDGRQFEGRACCGCVAAAAKRRPPSITRILATNNSCSTVCTGWQELKINSLVVIIKPAAFEMERDRECWTNEYQLLAIERREEEEKKSRVLYSNGKYVAGPCPIFLQVNVWNEEKYQRRFFLLPRCACRNSQWSIRLRTNEVSRFIKLRVVVFFLS